MLLEEWGSVSEVCLLKTSLFRFLYYIAAVFVNTVSHGSIICTKKIKNKKQRSPAPSYDIHPDCPTLKLVGKKVPNIHESLRLCKEAHLKLCPNVPLAGWDVALIDDEVAECKPVFLETNLSCNFFLGSFDKPSYYDFVEKFMTKLDSSLRPFAVKYSSLEYLQQLRNIYSENGNSFDDSELASLMNQSQKSGGKNNNALSSRSNRNKKSSNTQQDPETKRNGLFMNLVKRWVGDDEASGGANITGDGDVTGSNTNASTAEEEMMRKKRAIWVAAMRVLGPQQAQAAGGKKNQ